MSTFVQIEANRLNAQLSTGPVTDAGKQIVSQNALKHGLCGARAALQGEEAALAEHCQGYMQAYAPVGLPEQDLVRNLAENYWRLQRAHAMENALFERLATDPDQSTEAAAHADGWIDPAKGLQRLALYAARIQRTIDKIAAELKAMQAERKAAAARAHEQAVLLTRLARVTTPPFDPAESFGPPETCGGFVYSVPEIDRALLHADRLEAARSRFAPSAPDTSSDEA